MNSHSASFSYTPEVLYYDNHLVVVNKPAAMVTHEDGVHQHTLRSWVEQWVIKTFHKPSRAFVVPVHRLDQATSGIVVFAKTDKALSRMMAIFREREVKKFYILQTEQKRQLPEVGLWTDWLLRRESTSYVADSSSLGAQVAQMMVRSPFIVCGRLQWSVELLTGRHHQIRVQFASRGLPIIGDTRYGGIKINAQGILLHHARLEFQHPVQDKKMTFEAPVPAYWSQI